MARGEEARSRPGGPLRRRRDSPAGRTASAFAAAAAALIVAEAAVRVPAVSSRLPFPSRGIAHPLLDVRVELADRWARSGEAGCVFLGPSSLAVAVRPDLVSASFRESSGLPLRSFDFGVGGLTLSGARVLGRVIVGRYRPRLLVVGVFPFHVLEGVSRESDKAILSDPWILQRLGRFSLRGWMTDRLASFRVFLSAREWLERPEDYFARAHRSAHLTASGYGRVEGPRGGGDDERDPRPAGPGALVRSADLFGTYERLLDLNSETALVIAEAPVQPLAHEGFPRGGPEYQRVMDELEASARDRGVPVLRLGPRRFEGRGLWRNRSHMTMRGAALYSRWLGGRLADLARAGRIALPSGGAP